MTTDKILDHLIDIEGGYVDDPDDRGGCTKYGITRETLSEWRSYEVSCQEVADLEKPEAREIYRVRYIQEPRIDELPVHLQALLVDSAVQHGAEQAIVWLQEAAGTAADGIIGPNTLDAVHDANVEGLYRKALAKRIRYYGEIITNDHSQATFAHGWMRRVTKFLETA